MIKIYPNEPDIFTYNGFVYDVNKLYELVKHNTVQHAYIDDLKWIVDGERNKEDYKIFTTKLRTPLLVVTFDNKKTVVGGLNELRGAIGEGIKSMSCYYVDNYLQQAVVQTTFESLKDKPPTYLAW